MENIMISIGVICCVGLITITLIIKTRIKKIRNKNQIIKIFRKNMPLFIKQMKVGELDKAKCSTKFLSHNLNNNVIVNVKCYEDGTLDLRGKKEEYRIIVPDNIIKQH